MQPRKSFASPIGHFQPIFWTAQVTQYALCRGSLAQDLVICPSIASSPKSQVQTVGLLVKHDGFRLPFGGSEIDMRTVSVGRAPAW